MVELQVQLTPQVRQGRLRVVREAQQRLAVLDLADSDGPVVALDPRLEQLLYLGEFPFVLVVQGMVVIIVLGPGDELLQYLFAILGEHELLVEADRLGRCPSGQGS